LDYEGLLAYADTYRWEDVFHPLLDLGHTLVFESVAMAGLTLDIASIACNCSFGCDSETCITRMRILAWLW
jgi:hypothetical protein